MLSPWKGWSKEVSGGAAWDRVATLHVRAKLTTSGLQGTTESYDDLARGRTLDRFSLGPLSGAQGFDGKRVGSTDQAGQPREEEGAEARLAAVNEAYRRRLAYWYPERAKARLEHRGERAEQGRAFQVLAITPEGGRPFELWIDGATFLVDRTVEKTSMETRTTFFSDYRDVQGIKLAFRIRSTNGEAKYDQLLEVASAQIGEPVADDLFAKAFAVIDVLGGGPAHGAGLRAGDRILSVDGKSAAATGLPALRALLRTRAPGQRVALEVETDGRRRTVTVVLREIA